VIATLAPRFERLPTAQRHLWPALGPARELGFVLYGGTAVSLHLGHRRSLDFDFFHDRPLDARSLRNALPLLRAAQTLQEQRDTLVISVGRRAPVKLSFFGGLSYGRIGDPVLTADGVVEVASLEDLLAHKLKVILQRAERKDYEDIAAMLRVGVSLATGLAGARLLFGKAFQPAESVKALTYFRDGDLPRFGRLSRETLIAAAAAMGDLPRLRVRSHSLAIPV
jgi:Nucleotidyl transferase AbiEii toxin, Type IV TA system